MHARQDSSHGATCPVQSPLTEDWCVLGAGIETVWRRNNRERRGDINTEFKAMADRASPTKHRNALPLLTLLLPEKQLIAMTTSKWAG